MAEFTNEDLLGVIERNALSTSAQTERLGLENLNKTDSNAQDVGNTVERFGFANLDSTRNEGAAGRGETERFGFENLSYTGRASDLGISASNAAKSTAETYGYRNVVATKDSEKEILSALCASTAGLSHSAREILLQVAGGTKDVLLSSAQNTAALQMSLCSDTRDILLQAGNDTASIKAQSSEQFKDVLLQSSSNTAAIRSDLARDIKDVQMQSCESTDSIKSQASDQFKDLLLQSANFAKEVALTACINAKDAHLTAVINAKDAALAASTHFEKLSGQADRNASAIQAAIAECCCENKSLIIERTGHTDALIRSLEESRVKDELMEARLKILALENKIPRVSVAA